MIVLLDARVRTRRDALLLDTVRSHLQDTIRAAEPSLVMCFVNENTPTGLPDEFERVHTLPESAGGPSNFLDRLAKERHATEDVLRLAPLAGPLRPPTVAEAMMEARAAASGPAVVVRVRRLPSRLHPAFLQPLPLAAMEGGRLVTHARLKPWSQVLAEGGVDAGLAAILPFDSGLEGAGSQFLPRLPYVDGSLELIPNELIVAGRYREHEYRRYVEIGPHEGSGLEGLLYETA